MRGAVSVRTSECTYIRDVVLMIYDSRSVPRTYLGSHQIDEHSLENSTRYNYDTSSLAESSSRSIFLVAALGGEDSIPF